MKTIIKLVLAALLCGAVPQTKATGLGEFIGVSEKINSTIFGETTITPHYQINTWNAFQDQWGNGSEEASRSSIRYAIVTGAFFYKHAVLGGSGWIADTNPFDPVSVTLWNSYCTAPGGITAIYAQSYDCRCWVTVVNSGMIGPTGPFDVSFKTVGTLESADCTPPPNYTREFRKTVSVPAYGSVTVRVGKPNYDFAYPFQCWAGYIYQY